MKLLTKVEIEKYPCKISYGDKILFLGSCFANEIGSVMSNLRFKVLVNPFGVLYNPASITNSLERLVSKMQFSQSDIIVDGDIFKSLFHSSEFASMSMDGLPVELNKLLLEASNHFNESKWIVMSLGTRWFYRLNSNGAIVANCHKLSQDKFTREALSVDEIVDMFSAFISTNPDKIWLFTVSPVRHWKDGAHGNQLSKAVLLCAIEKLQSLFSNVLYFPAYEILLDEMRDYRFYSQDMIHPSAVAIEYIWERFRESLIDESALDLMSDVVKLNFMNNHKPFFPESKAFLDFEEDRNSLEKIVRIKLKNL